MAKQWDSENTSGGATSRPTTKDHKEDKPTTTQRTETPIQGETQVSSEQSSNNGAAVPHPKTDAEQLSKKKTKPINGPAFFCSEGASMEVGGDTAT